MKFLFSSFFQVMSTTDVVTRVVITDPPAIETLTSDPGTIDVTKTYFVTYTYFSTYVENDETKVSSHVSVSTDIAVETFTIRGKKTSGVAPSPTSVSITPTKTTDTKVESDKLNGAHYEKLSSEFPDESENSIATPELEKNDDQLTAASGDLIDEWYEKFKIKPTTENEVSKTRLKTKTTIKHKLKTKTTTKTTTSLPVDPTSTYSTSVVMTSTVTPQGTTLMPGDQVIVIYGENGHTSMIPLTDPAKKKQKNGTEVQVSDMLSLGALGINSINVLGPMFNAMADMLKNHQKDALKKRNDTVQAPSKKTPNTNPLLSFMSNLSSGEAKNPKTTTTTQRAPLYIPVGSFAEDADSSESESRISILPKPEKWVQEKWPPNPTHHLDKNRRTHDNSPIPHLEGGIPISPGQVITTNSDVIIGRPSDSGPRPPNFAIKDNLPVDMKPPPIEEQRVHLDPVGQFSTNQGVDPDIRPIDDLIMKPPPAHAGRPQPPSSTNHGRPHGPMKQGRPQSMPSHIHAGRPSKQPHGHQHHPHDSGVYDLNPPPPPPMIHHQASIVPIPVHLNPDEVVENYVNPVHFQPDNLALPNEIIPTPSIPREISKVIDRSSGQPLLVNIQPSQVAQVMIPHGSSSAVIISEEQPHATKGEVIDDPSPHPEPETVGFIGAEPVLKVDNNEILHRPVNSMLEVIKADSHLHQHQQHPQSSHASETVNIRPRPDYDNIGMKPPSEPKHTQKPQYAERPQQVQYPQHQNHQQHPQQQQRPQHPQLQLQPQYTLSKKDPSGIYVDISPPGHLPPPPKPQRPSNSPPPSQQAAPPENLSNHQSGLVHDVPLVAQVQLGSGKPESAPLNEILINFDADRKPSSGAQTNDENFNFVRRPGDNFEADLAPPPPPPRPSRPPGPNHAPGHIQRFPIPHGKPKYPQTVPEPADFMMPPPKPNYGNPMVIPVGAGASDQNPNSRPGEIQLGQPSDYDGEEDMEADANDPFKTEDGEEIQESNTRPLLPGQLPTEVEKLLQNHTSYPIKTDQSNIGVGQTLSFGNNNDKADDNNPPGVREPETIVGSHMHGGHSGPSGFNKNNEAVVSVGSQPMMEGSSDAEIDEAEKMFGMKLPSNQNLKGENLTRKDDVKDIFKHPEPDEVMGLSPPPLDRPRRPLRPQRPNAPFRFEKPTTDLLLTPLNVENDFPPVRSPEMNKKPFKPEDVFPPRLPENFVYREYEISTRRPVNRRPSVTSMPIDSPTSSTTETSAGPNGHSKPMGMDNQSTQTDLPAVDRPRPVVHERPPSVNLQKPSSRPPPRQPPPRVQLQHRPDTHDNQHPPRQPNPIDTPPRGHADSDTSIRGQPPFPFERPNMNGDVHFGDKMRPPSQQMNPPKGQPPRGNIPTGFEQSPKRPSYEKPPPRGELPSVFESPPPRYPPSRPPQNRPPTGFDQPPRQPPAGFEHSPPSRPPASGLEHLSNRPSGFNHPQNRPSTVEHQQTRPPPSGFEQPPTRSPPSGFERPPPSPTPSEYEQPPPRGQQPSSAFDEPPLRDNRPPYQSPPRQQPPKFEAPPNRVEPSPHFEGQPPQGQPPKVSQATPDSPSSTGDIVPNVSNQGQRKPPAAMHKPPHQHQSSGEHDQQPQPTTASETKENDLVFDQTPERNEPTRYEEKAPPPEGGSPSRPSYDEERLQKQPPRVQLPSYKPTPAVKPPKMPIPSREPIRPTPSMTRPSANIVTSIITSGSTTIFGDLYTEPMLLQPTRVVTSNQGVQFTVASFPNQQNSSPQVNKSKTLSTLLGKAITRKKVSLEIYPLLAFSVVDI